MKYNVYLDQALSNEPQITATLNYNLLLGLPRAISGTNIIADGCLMSAGCPAHLCEKVGEK